MNITLAVLAALAFHLVGYLPVTAARCGTVAVAPEPTMLPPSDHQQR
jgi:hypothetical protein